MNLKWLKNKMDYSEYGGAGLFGLNSPVIKAHGSSNGRCYLSCNRQARTMVEHNVADINSTNITKGTSNDKNCFYFPWPRFTNSWHG